MDYLLPKLLLLVVEFRVLLLTKVIKKDSKIITTGKQDESFTTIKFQTVRMCRSKFFFPLRRREKTDSEIEIYESS